MNVVRSSFSKKIGLMMAASTAAIGLGNLWRFPYEVSHNGGGIFVVIYLILAFTFGISLLMMETAFGRKTGKTSISAFRGISKKYRFLGYLMAVGPIMQLCYYVVIGGWVLKWFFESVIGNLSTLSAGTFWDEYITGMAGGFAQPIVWFMVFLLICLICILLGVNKGIERTSQILMPMLFILMVVVIVFELFTVDGIVDGIAFYLSPNTDDLSAGTFLAASGQVFFSLSIGMGILITYGSYTKKDVNLERTASSVCLMDSSAALLAGLMIVPVAFLFGFPDSEGMGLMFTALPQVFSSMPGGAFVAPVFYLLTAFAAVTSAIALAEAGASTISDSVKLDRKRSTMIVGAIVIAAGTVCTLGFAGGPLAIDTPFTDTMGWVGLLDGMVCYIIGPVNAIIMCLFFGYVVKTAYLEEEIEISSRFRLKKAFRVMIRYLAPVLLITILVTGLADLLT